MPDSDLAPGRPTAERVRGIFSQIADKYDLFNALASMGIDRSWRRELVRAAALTPESRVLDLASGTGDVAFALANLGRPAEVVATDFVPEMLASPRRRPPSTRRRCRCRSRVPTPRTSRSTTRASTSSRSRSACATSPSASTNFAEVLRVLKPGGRYIILEFSRPPFAPWRGVYHVYLRHAIPRDRRRAHRRPRRLRLPQRLHPPVPGAAGAGGRTRGRWFQRGVLEGHERRDRRASYRGQV